MPTIPKRVTLTNTASEVLNVIRNQASQNYKDYVPFAQQNAESIRAIGAVIMDYPELQNEFLNALVNRIARVVVNSLAFSNPWSKFKRGFLEFGETVEELWVDIAIPHEFDPEEAETELFKREKPNVKSAFHIMNYQKFYKTTISRDQLKQAFLSVDGVNNLVNKIVETLYTAMEYDEFLTMRYLMARKVLDGQMYYIPSSVDLSLTDPATIEANAKKTLADLRALNNDLVFPSRLYNIAGVLNKTPIDKQQIIIDGRFEGHVDVYALASAFNLNYADFMAKRILTPRFYFNEDELDRLALLFKDNPEYRPVTTSENENLESVYAFIVDDDWFMIFDNLQEMGDVRNIQGLYWNYLLHSWKTFSTSPFMNAVALVGTGVFDPTDPAEYTVALSDMLGNPVEGNVLKTNTTYVLNVETDDVDKLPSYGVIKSIVSDNEKVAVDVSRGTITTTTATDPASGDDPAETVTVTVMFENDTTATLTFTVA